MSALEILGRAVARLNRAIAEIIPELPAFGDPEEHAEATARALLAEVERLREALRMEKLNYAGATEDFAEIRRVVGFQPREGPVEAVKRLVRERDEARAEVLAYVAEADEQIRLRDEARAQLAALREASADVRVAFDDLSIPHSIAVGRHAALARALADTAAAAEAYRASVEAPLRAEIDALDDLIPRSSSDEDPAVAQRTLVQRAEALCMDVTAAHRDLAIVAAEHDTLAAALAEVIARLPATFRADGSIAAVDREWLTRQEVRRIVAALEMAIEIERGGAR